MSEKQQEPPKIEFPCPNYPIKVVGVNSDNFRGFVIKITAQGVDQLKALHEALIASDRVKMVI
jgi:putative lipoic acid-binding regulatory protein